VQTTPTVGGVGATRAADRARRTGEATVTCSAAAPTAVDMDTGRNRAGAPWQRAGAWLVSDPRERYRPRGHSGSFDSRGCEMSEASAGRARKSPEFGSTRTFQPGRELGEVATRMLGGTAMDRLDPPLPPARDEGVRGVLEDQAVRGTILRRPSATARGTGADHEQVQ
jgi:hypothetical protein